MTDYDNLEEGYHEPAATPQRDEAGPPIPTWLLPFPGTYRHDHDDAGTISDFLLASDLDVHGVSVTVEGIVIECLTDPSDVLRGYTPSLTPQERRQAAKDELLALNLNNATTAQLRQAMRLVVKVLELEGQ